MTTMQVAFKAAGVNPAIFMRKVKWPRKKNNKVNGVRKDVTTGEKIGKVGN